LDSLDIKIFRELTQDRRTAPLNSNIRESFRRISARLQVDEDTVRLRIKKLSETGFLVGWYAIVNPELLHLKIARIFVDLKFESKKAELLKKIKHIPDIFAIADCFGGSVVFYLAYENNQRLQEWLAKIKDTCEITDMIWNDVPFPHVRAIPSTSDWNIICAIERNPRKSVITISEETGLSTRTVKRRLEKMTNNNILFILPKLDVRKLEGVVVAAYLILYDSPKSKSEVDGKILLQLSGFLAVTEMSDSEHAFVVAPLKNVHQADEVSDWLRKQRGVKSVRLRLVKERIDSYDLFTQLLSAKCPDLTHSQG
jgi:DNA-binding Lrp family transcriptional regulator